MLTKSQYALPAPAFGAPRSRLAAKFGSVAKRKSRAGPLANGLHLVKKVPRILTRVISDKPGMTHAEEILPTDETLSYQWTKQWYPLRVVDELEQDRPNHAAFLGKDVVIWKDGTGRWNCFSDMCPHRLAPLSEGRIEADGNLLCAYHAWRFDGDGHCVKVPQARNKTDEQSIRGNVRACADVYPIQELQGLLWVWGESGPNAIEESKLKKPLIVEELEDPSLKGRVQPLLWTMFDLAYSWDYFMENVLDPAHVMVSHHGIIGSRYEEDQYVNIQPLEKTNADKGFNALSSGKLGRSRIEFKPPSLVRINTLAGSETVSALVLHATPTVPGRCVHIGAQLLIDSDTSSSAVFSSVFFTILRIVPKWIIHFLAPSFIFQDLVLIHRQDVYRKKYAKDKAYHKAYFLQHCDKLVSRFRKWFQEYGGGAIPWQTGKSESDAVMMEYDDLLDNWQAHTKNCAICKAALKNLKKLRIVLSSLAIMTCFAGMQFIIRNRSSPPGLLKQSMAPAVILLLSGAVMLLNKAIEMYYKRDFHHADNN